MIFININKDLGAFSLDIKLNIKQGEFIALSGESGSGKTSLLRLVAGLDQASGEIDVEGKKWLMNNRSLPPQKRDIGYVTQEYALFSNMSVIDNLMFVKKDITLAKYLLNVTGLSEYKNYKPQSLSGGQRQRVALCRALIAKPKLLLLDEALSALDFKTRVTLQEEIIKFHKEFNLTTIMVSHDRAEVLKMANRVVQISRGKIVNIFNKKDLKIDSKIDGRLVDIVDNYALIDISGQVVKVEISSLNKEYKIGGKIELNLNL